MNVAQSVRLAKEKWSEDYCADPKCLWRTVVRGEWKPCGKHPHLKQVSRDGGTLRLVTTEQPNEANEAI